MVKVVDNPGAHMPVLDAPRKDNGEPFQFEMISPDGKQRIYAGTATELLGYLIPGYMEEQDEVRQAALRLKYAVTCQVQLQSSILAENMEDVSDEEFEILQSPRDTPPVVEVWESEVPLVLITTYYLPVGELPRPIGRPLEFGAVDSNLIWLDPSGEFELLLSLHQAGHFILAERKTINILQSGDR